jgi:hypothetical protein
MNTSFGPRINRNKWDFHDGIDLPAAIGTKVHAVRGGTVRHAGPAGTAKISSRHVVMEIEEPDDGLLFIYYLHLDSIAPAARNGIHIDQGQIIGRVGKDNAAYSHLHLEFRKGSHEQENSLHPLHYLPYKDTANVSAPVPDRFNAVGDLMTARLRFTMPSRLEGDLAGIEVDLKQGKKVLKMCKVDFDDKSTVNEGIGDHLVFLKDVGVEGYQQSNLRGHKREDLQYGILVRNIPETCDTLVATVRDLSGNFATSDPIQVQRHTATNLLADFENGEMPPTGWVAITSTTGSGTSVSSQASAAYSGSRGMLCLDKSASGSSTQRAGLESSIPPGRFEWRTEAWVNPVELSLDPHKSLYLFSFLSDSKLSAAAGLVRTDDGIHPLLITVGGTGASQSSLGKRVIKKNVWRRWKLDVLRLGTRETTAVLYISEPGKTVERVRLNWDSSEREPDTFRAGIARSPAGAKAKIYVDDIRLTESL